MLAKTPKKFWNMVNPKDKLQISLFDLAHNPHSDLKCTGILNMAFANALSSICNIQCPSLSMQNTLSVDPINVDDVGIGKIIDPLPLSSSAGGDLITPKFLKSTIVYSSIFLSRISQQ